jgi:hypothetical protein
MLEKEPGGLFERFRWRNSGKLVWAKRMPEDFRIETVTGVVDQRKAGARHKREYVTVLTGSAGDYLIVSDLGTGQRFSFPGANFDETFEPAPDIE